MSRFYVYTLAYPPEMGGAVFYVGKGSGNRIDQHELDARQGMTGERYAVIRKIWADGGEVIKCKVFETNDEDGAFDYERHLIANFDISNLTNGRDGGTGGRARDESEYVEKFMVSMDPETFADLQELMRRRRMSRSGILKKLVLDEKDRESQVAQVASS